MHRWDQVKAVWKKNRKSNFAGLTFSCLKISKIIIYFENQSISSNVLLTILLIVRSFVNVLKWYWNLLKICMHVHVLNVFKNHWFIVGQLTSVILYWSTHKLYCHLREILQYCTGYHRMKFITFFITVTVQLRKSPKQHKMMRRPRNYGKFQKRWLDSKNEWTVNKDHNEWTNTINI